MDKYRFEIELLPCYKRIFSVCLTIVRDRDEAADAVQETYVRLWERRSDLDKLDSIEAYALTIAKRICIGKLRSRETVIETENNADTEPFEYNLFEQADELRLVRSLLKQLPENQRKVVELSAYGDCSNDEIAELTGETPGNVRQLLSHGRRKLKELYNHYTR